MKYSLLSLVIVCAFSATIVQADDTYVATLTGVDCNGCKKTIAKSLGKIDGVKVIRIKKNGNGTHKMTVITDGNAPLSKEQAVAAIKRADHYQIKSWAKQN